MRKLLLLISILPCLLADGAFAAPPTDKLPTGLTVAWFPNPRVPLVDVVLWIPCGEKSDAKGKGGTARLLTSIIEERGQNLESLGATVSASAGADSVTIAVHGLAEDKDRFLAFLAESVRPFAPTSGELESQRERVLDSLTHLEDRASTLAVLGFQQFVSAGTPYSRGPLEMGREIAKIKAADLTAYASSWIRPKEAVLLVAGQVDRATLLPELTALFSTWMGEPNRIRDKASTPSSKLPDRALVLHRAGLNQAQIVMGFRGAPYAHKDRHALAIANALFGEYFNSRLNSIIRDQLGLTYAIGSQWSYNRDLGVFSISASTENSSVGTVVTRIKQALDEFSGGAIADEELNQARDYLIGSHYLRMDSLYAQAAQWLSLRAFGVPNDLEDFEKRLRSVTLEELKAAVKRHLDPKKLYVVIAGDGGEVSKSLKAANIKLRQATLRDLSSSPQNAPRAQ